MKSTITQGAFTAILYDVSGWPFYEVRQNPNGLTVVNVTKQIIEPTHVNIIRQDYPDYTTIINKCWEELDKG